MVIQSSKKSRSLKNAVPAPEQAVASAPAEPEKPRLSREALERVAGIFAAFADATRLAILQELRPGRLSVGGLVTALGTSQANISKHLKLLHQAGLLTREREGLQVFYRAAEEAVYDMCQYACRRLNENARAAVPAGPFE